jgi:hypothetical protein
MENGAPVVGPDAPIANPEMVSRTYFDPSHAAGDLLHGLNAKNTVWRRHSSRNLPDRAREL